MNGLGYTFVGHQPPPPPASLLIMALRLPVPSAETPAPLHFRISPKPRPRPHLPSATTAAVRPSAQLFSLRHRLGHRPVVSVGTEETELRVSSGAEHKGSSPEDLECVQRIQRAVELLKKKRDMLFGEVKLTIMLEDPRDTERKRLLGIEDPDGVTRDDLVAALEDVNEGRIPENRVALWLLAKEMMEWPDLEHLRRVVLEYLYAKATDTGVDPEVAAKKLNIDWDSAADIEHGDEND